MTNKPDKEKDDKKKAAKPNSREAMRAQRRAAKGGDAAKKPAADKKAKKDTDADDESEEKDPFEEIEIPGFEKLDEELNSIITHNPPLAADNHRPVLPGTNEERVNFFMSREMFKWAFFIAGCFSLIMYFFMLVNHIRILHSNPVDSQQLIDLKDRLKKLKVQIEDSKDKALKEKLQGESDAVTEAIRDLDFELRREYFTLIGRKGPGTWIMFASLILFVIFARLWYVFRPQVPQTFVDMEKGEKQMRERRLGRISIYGMWIFLMLTGSALLATKKAEPPGALYEAYLAANQEAVKKMEKRIPSAEELKANWPFFRGSDYSNKVDNAEIPDTWDVGAGKNLLWASDVRLKGTASPVIWEDRLYISGATGKTREIYCYNLADGSLRWTYSQKSTGRKAKKAAPTVFADYMYAASTLVVDGQRVYGIFANGDLVCVDMYGKLKWEVDLELPDNPYGHSSALVMYKDKLYVQWDHAGSSAAIFAFDIFTGRRVWKIDRNHYESSWASPVIMETEKGPQLIAVAEPEVAALNPDTGELIWKAKAISGELGASPTPVGNLMLVGDEAMAMAVKPGGKGDVTKSHVAWKKEDGVFSGIASIVSDGKHFWIVSADGVLSCRQVSDGKLVYEKELEMEIWATPLILGDKILITGTKGRCLLISTEPSFKLITEAKLAKGTYATPVYFKKRLYFRDGEKLVCIGNN